MDESSSTNIRTAQFSQSRPFTASWLTTKQPRMFSGLFFDLWPEFDGRYSGHIAECERFGDLHRRGMR